ncbi:hypothetical protein S4A8_16257 [Salinisphaera sp. S4-8]|uniref:EpsG family protein n=1 Tax=Salinisphaera sp. S4-8 TaxID=633357 RepID=UPI00333F670A
MFIYWAVFVCAGVVAVARLRVSVFGWVFLGVALTVFVGLRYEVGGDWDTYLGYLVRVTGKPLPEVLAYKDPGYQIVNWFAARVGFDIWFVNLVAAGVFVFGLIRFIVFLPDPRIALAISIPYMVIVMAMGYTRQAMAFGLVLWGLTFLIRRQLLSFVVVLALAATFHKSAVILVPLAILANTKNRVWSAIWIGATGIILFMLLLQEHVDALYRQYVLSDYSEASDGGPVRALMNALPAIVFVAYRNRFKMQAEERSLWLAVSMLCLACLPLLLFSVTAVDRVALYLMPIQLVVASHLTGFVSARTRVISRVAILGVYALVMFVWLNYAGHREAWLPYRFWPFA